MFLYKIYCFLASPGPRNSQDSRKRVWKSERCMIRYFPRRQDNFLTKSSFHVSEVFPDVDYQTFARIFNKIVKDIFRSNILTGLARLVENNVIIEGFCRWKLQVYRPSDRNQGYENNVTNFVCFISWQLTSFSCISDVMEDHWMRYVQFHVMLICLNHFMVQLCLNEAKHR
jgi:hypothetical protein